MARVALGWTQRELADKCGLAVPTIARIELELVDMRSSNANKIEKVFCEHGIGFALSGKMETVIFKGKQNEK